MSSTSDLSDQRTNIAFMALDENPVTLLRPIEAASVQAGITFAVG
jgi:hypothetical protein